MTPLQAVGVLLPLLASAALGGHFESFGDFGGERAVALIPGPGAQLDSPAAFRGRLTPVAGATALGPPVFPPPPPPPASEAAAAAAAPERRPAAYANAPAQGRLPAAYAAAPLAVQYYPVPQPLVPQPAALGPVPPPAVFRSAPAVAEAAPRPHARPRGPAPVFAAQPAADFRGHAVPAPAAAPHLTSYQVQHDRPLAPPRARLSGSYTYTPAAAAAAAAAPTQDQVSRAPLQTANSGRARYDGEDDGGDTRGFDFGGHGFGFGTDNIF